MANTHRNEHGGDKNPVSLPVPRILAEHSAIAGVQGLRNDMDGLGDGARQRHRGN